ncbi:hypothetical protein L1049_000441 [Liquidambar formosana]|uniref:Uncharacterized protein n=1 Tax=Liquidambar formosana TaxID=63359 RepID=A0AAP0R7Q3_LIQFO
MATPLLLLGTNDPTMQEPTKTFIGSEETKSETAKQRGKRSSKSKSPSKKKQPQRGMGVAQLERLRLQERWKVMTETNPLPPFNIQNQFQYQFPHSFSNSPSGGPAAFPAANYGGDQLGLNRVLMLQTIGNGGFNGVFVGGSCGSGGAGGWGYDQVQVDPRFRIENVFETSKELTSMPKMQCVSDQFDSCLKKKPSNRELFGFNGGREKVTAVSPINGYDRLELNLGNNHSINGQRRDFGARAARRAGGNPEEVVEVMAIHRKGNSVGGSLLMEYEFFPGNGDSRSTSTTGGEAIFTTASTTTSDTNASCNSIDLSLKLSF